MTCQDVIGLTRDKRETIEKYTNQNLTPHFVDVFCVGVAYLYYVMKKVMIVIVIRNQVMKVMAPLDRLIVI